MFFISIISYLLKALGFAEEAEALLSAHKAKKLQQSMPLTDDEEADDIRKLS
jgi:hypothetical protein